jgi:hypothetical protein
VIALVFAAALLLQPAQGRSETIAGIQVHGNTVTTDDEVQRAAAVRVGDPLEADTLETVSARLRATKRFQSVQVLKRFASIDDPTQILLVIVVDDGPVRIERTGDPDQPTRVVRSHGTPLMFLPVLSFEDGYGFTYGARFAWPEPVGKQSRVSFPLTWGGEKRAGAELEKNLQGGPLDRVEVGVSASRRTNPFYDVDDDRVRLWARGERDIVRWVRAGATVGWQRVAFPGAAAPGATFPGAAAPGTPAGGDRFAHAGADVVFDTRADPILPRNAVYARAAFEHIAGANRMDLEARGYVGLVGQAILAVRAQRSDADRALPPYLKPLLGGISNLRGFRAGTAAGDALVATSAELIVPLTSPLSFGRIGVNAFTDAGTTYDHGERLSDQTWRQGIGGGVWFSAAFVRLNVDVAHGRGASTRVHVGANVSF